MEDARVEDARAQDSGGSDASVDASRDAEPLDSSIDAAAETDASTDAGCVDVLPSWTGHSGFLGTGRVVVLGDVDGDDDLDFASVGDDAVEWWENVDGSGEVLTAHPVGTGAVDAAGLWIDDLDGDDDADVWAAVGGSFIVFENLDGVGTDWEPHVAREEPLGASAVQSADIDGDTDLDLVGSTGGTDTVLWMENLEGDGSTWEEHAIDTSYLRAVSVRAADFDGDGSIDIAAASAEMDDVRVWLNDDGSGTTWAYQFVDVDYDGVTQIDVADMDGDEDRDIVAGSEHGVYNWPEKVSWWENDGTGTAWTFHDVSINPGNDIIQNAPEVKAADIDGDETMDVVGHQVVPTSGAHGVWWWQDTGLQQWEPHLVAEDFEAQWIDAGDVDGDGDTDVVGASLVDSTWWENGPACP